MKKPFVGQKLWLKAVGNNARYGAKISEGTVTKIGNKYFTVVISDGRLEHQFYLETWGQNVYGSANWHPYESEQAIHDENKANELYREIRKQFERYQNSFSLEQLTQIAEILNLTNNK